MEITFNKRNYSNRYNNRNSPPVGTFVKDAHVTSDGIGFSTKRNASLAFFLLLLGLIPGILYLCLFKSKHIEIKNSEVVNCTYYPSIKNYYLETKKHNYTLIVRQISTDVNSWLRIQVNGGIGNAGTVNMNVKNINVTKEDRLKTKERLLDLKDLRDSGVISKVQYEKGVKDALNSFSASDAEAILKETN